jgi:hypothetical protein
MISNTAVFTPVILLTTLPTVSNDNNTVRPPYPMQLLLNTWKRVAKAVLAMQMWMMTSPLASRPWLCRGPLGYAKLGSHTDFVRKWGQMIEGCVDLIIAINGKQVGGGPLKLAG